MILQTMHAYGPPRGHGVVVAPPGLDPSILQLIDASSDLDGYRPTNDPREVEYHVGFRVGPYFVFMKTWDDPLSGRGGTMISHALLVPLEAWVAAADPFAWTQLHRRPLGYTDTDGFDRELPLDVEPMAWPTSLPPHEGDEVVGLLERFDQVVWLGPPTLDHVRAAWPSMPLERRSSFSFRTYAVGQASKRYRFALTTTSNFVYGWDGPGCYRGRNGLRAHGVRKA